MGEGHRPVLLASRDYPKGFGTAMHCSEGVLSWDAMDQEGVGFEPPTPWLLDRVLYLLSQRPPKALSDI